MKQVFKNQNEAINSLDTFKYSKINKKNNIIKVYFEFILIIS